MMLLEKLAAGLPGGEKVVGKLLGAFKVRVPRKGVPLKSDAGLKKLKEIASGSQRNISKLKRSGLPTSQEARNDLAMKAQIAQLSGTRPRMPSVKKPVKASDPGFMERVQPYLDKIKPWHVAAALPVAAGGAYMLGRGNDR